MPERPILLTGARGHLGTELQRLLPGIIPLNRPEFDLVQPETIAAAFDRHRPEVILHAAAFTDVAGAEKDRDACWKANVVGTRNVVREALRCGTRLVHISTDYVFEGTAGGYREEDPLGPALNYYALSKIAAEEVARVAPRHLIIRTSFRPREWPYAVAFSDVFTSQDYVDVIAPQVALAIRHIDAISDAALHIATERKSVYDLARRRKPDVKAGSKDDVSVRLPNDISLDVSRWIALKRLWGAE